MDPVIRIIIDAINNSDAGLRDADRGLGDLRTRVEQVDAETKRYIETNYNLGQGVDEVGLSMAESDNQFEAHRNSILENDQALQNLEVTNGELRDSIARVVEGERERIGAELEAAAATEVMGDSTESAYQKLRAGALELRKFFTLIGTLAIVGRLVARGYKEIEQAAEDMADSGLVVADAYKEQVERGKENTDFGLYSLTVMTKVKSGWSDLMEAVFDLTDAEATLHEARQAGLITDRELMLATDRTTFQAQLLKDAQKEGSVGLLEQQQIQQGATESQRIYADTLAGEVRPALDEYKQGLEDAATAEERHKENTERLSGALNDLKTAMGMTSEIEAWEEDMGEAQQAGEDLRAKMAELELNPELAQELEDVRAEYVEWQGDVQKLEEDHDTMIKEMIFGIAEAQIAAYLASEDYDAVIAQGMIDALYGVVDTWGLVRDSELQFILDSGQAIQGYIEGDIVDLEEALNEVARDRVINFDWKLAPIPQEWKDVIEGTPQGPPAPPDYYGGGRASGGPISGGMGYLVHRDEMIVTGADGYVFNPQQVAGMGGNSDALLESIDQKLSSLNLLPRELAAVLGTALAKRSAF